MRLEEDSGDWVARFYPNNDPTFGTTWVWKLKEDLFRRSSDKVFDTIKDLLKDIEH
jgi:hypothetical protein